MSLLSRYSFDSWTFDPADGTVRGSGGLHRLAPKVSDTLTYLLDHAHRVIAKEELLSAVWGDIAVEEIGLARNICTIRKALGAEGSRIIQTIPKRGYRLVADVRQLNPGDTLAAGGAQTPGTLLETARSLRACAQALADFYFGEASGFRIAAR